MQPRTRWIAAAGLAVAVAGAVAAATAAGDSDQELTGPTRHRAVGDDNAAYGVEVRLPDGRQVEVNLDKSFKVVGQEPDDDQPGQDERRGP